MTMFLRDSNSTAANPTLAPPPPQYPFQASHKDSAVIQLAGREHNVAGPHSPSQCQTLSFPSSGLSMHRVSYAKSVHPQRGSYRVRAPTKEESPKSVLYSRHASRGSHGIHPCSIPVAKHPPERPSACTQADPKRTPLLSRLLAPGFASAVGGTADGSSSSSSIRSRDSELTVKLEPHAKGPHDQRDSAVFPSGQSGQHKNNRTKIPSSTYPDPNAFEECFLRPTGLCEQESVDRTCPPQSSRQQTFYENGGFTAINDATNEYVIPAGETDSSALSTTDSQEARSDKLAYEESVDHHRHDPLEEAEAEETQRLSEAEDVGEDMGNRSPASETEITPSPNNTIRFPAMFHRVSHAYVNENQGLPALSSVDQRAVFYRGFLPHRVQVRQPIEKDETDPDTNCTDEMQQFVEEVPALHPKLSYSRVMRTRSQPNLTDDYVNLPEPSFVTWLTTTVPNRYPMVTAPGYYLHSEPCPHGCTQITQPPPLPPDECSPYPNQPAPPPSPPYRPFPWSYFRLPTSYGIAVPPPYGVDPCTHRVSVTQPRPPILGTEFVITSSLAAHSPKLTTVSNWTMHCCARGAPLVADSLVGLGKFEPTGGNVQMVSDTSPGIPPIPASEIDVNRLWKENQQLKALLRETTARLRYVDVLEWHLQRLSVLVESMLASHHRQCELDHQLHSCIHPESLANGVHRQSHYVPHSITATPPYASVLPNLQYVPSGYHPFPLPTSANVPFTMGDTSRAFFTSGWQSDPHGVEMVMSEHPHRTSRPQFGPGNCPRTVSLDRCQYTAKPHPTYGSNVNPSIFGTNRPSCQPTGSRPGQKVVRLAADDTIAFASKQPTEPLPFRSVQVTRRKLVNHDVLEGAYRSPTEWPVVCASTCRDKANKPSPHVKRQFPLTVNNSSASRPMGISLISRPPDLGENEAVKHLTPHTENIPVKISMNAMYQVASACRVCLADSSKPPVTTHEPRTSQIAQSPEKCFPARADPADYPTADQSREGVYETRTNFPMTATDPYDSKIDSGTVVNSSGHVEAEGSGSYEGVSLPRGVNINESERLTSITGQMELVSEGFSSRTQRGCSSQPRVEPVPRQVQLPFPHLDVVQQTNYVCPPATLTPVLSTHLSHEVYRGHSSQSTIDPGYFQDGPNSDRPSHVHPATYAANPNWTDVSAGRQVGEALKQHPDYLPGSPYDHLGHGHPRRLHRGSTTNISHYPPMSCIYRPSSLQVRFTPPENRHSRIHELCSDSSSPLQINHRNLTIDSIVSPHLLRKQYCRGPDNRTPHHY